MSCVWRQFEDSQGISNDFVPLPPERLVEIPLALDSVVPPEYFEYEGTYFAAGKESASGEWLYYALVCESPWKWPVVTILGLLAGIVIGKMWR